MGLSRFAFTEALRSLGNAEVFVGDFAGTAPTNWTSLGAKEGTISESITWDENKLTAPEHTGGIAHEITFTLGDFSVTIPIIAGDPLLWAKIEPSGTKDGIPDTPIDAVTTSFFLIPRKELPATGNMTYNGTVWTPTAPVNALFFPKAYVTHGDIGRPYENGGKSIVDVTFHPMFYALGPQNKRVYVRGDPVAAGYTTFRA